MWSIHTSCKIKGKNPVKLYRFTMAPWILSNWVVLVVNAGNNVSGPTWCYLVLQQKPVLVEVGRWKECSGRCSTMQNDTTLLVGGVVPWGRSSQLAEGKPSTVAAVSNLASNLIQCLHFYLHPFCVFLYAQDYRAAANAFVEARKLDPACDEIKTALRQCCCLMVSV
jgi:hypothetical protein